MKSDGDVDRARVLQSVCQLISDRDIGAAEATLVRDYPAAVSLAKRRSLIR